MMFLRRPLLHHHHLVGVFDRSVGAVLAVETADAGFDGGGGGGRGGWGWREC